MSSLLAVHSQLVITLLSVFFLHVSSVPLRDLDLDGYPTDFEVTAYACTGHFWFQQEWVDGKRKYIMDPPYNPETDHRWIFWSAADNAWRCYKPQNDIIWARCYDTNLFDCNDNLAIRYEISGNQSAGWYRRVNTDGNGFNYYLRETAPDRVILYDSDASQWRISNAYNGSTFYAICTSTNLFECEWIQTGLTADPTDAPTRYPTTTSQRPTDIPSKYS
eukprot:300598_1